MSFALTRACAISLEVLPGAAYGRPTGCESYHRVSSHVSNQRGGWRAAGWAVCMLEAAVNPKDEGRRGETRPIEGRSSLASDFAAEGWRDYYCCCHQVLWRPIVASSFLSTGDRRRRESGLEHARRRFYRVHVCTEYAVSTGTSQKRASSSPPLPPIDAE